MNIFYHQNLLGLTHISTMKGLTFNSCSVSEDQQIIESTSHGILPSLQHVTPRELAAALLEQVDTTHLSLLLSMPATTYTHHLPHWLRHSLQLFCCSKVPSLPLWLPLHSARQSFPALHHAPLYVYKVLSPLPPLTPSFSPPLFWSA